jgi:L-lactate dehydrogenase
VIVSHRARIDTLERFARDLFVAAGMQADKAATSAELLALTDALGRRTHGLAMVPLYLAELAKGAMRKAARSKS